MTGTAEADRTPTSANPSDSYVVSWGELQDLIALADAGERGKLVDAIRARATDALHETPCPGCGFEPEVVTYYRDKRTKVRCGYQCGCGALVIEGVVQAMGMR